ncbi:MAG TPA: hypothetical protein VGQ76_22850 [Thermoanaerobaculia bacterium]|jgi:hypothetical protein|nr:hypothetical protein [Thermoanaerobaculia bacterium]
MATYRSKALTGSPEPRFVQHVPDRVEDTCPECHTTSIYVKSNSGRPGTFVRMQGPTAYFCPNGHQWHAQE